MVINHYSYNKTANIIAKTLKPMYLMLYKQMLSS